METDKEPSETKEKKVASPAFFAIGITFIGAGIALGASTNAGLYGLTVVGFIFIIIGLANMPKSDQS
jgi:hypothetical protein